MLSGKWRPFWLGVNIMIERLQTYNVHVSIYKSLIYQTLIYRFANRETAVTKRHTR